MHDNERQTSAEVATQTGTQGQAVFGETLGGGVAGPSGSGQGVGYLGERIDRALRAWRAGTFDAADLDFDFDPRFAVGGVIAQLIADSQERLGEAIECIDWYERVRDREVAKLARWQALAGLRSPEPGDAVSDVSEG